MPRRIFPQLKLLIPLDFTFPAFFPFVGIKYHFVFPFVGML